MRPRKKVLLFFRDAEAMSFWRLRVSVRGWEVLAAATLDAALALLWVHGDCDLVLTEPAFDASIPSLYVERAVRVLLVGCTVGTAIDTCATATEVEGPYLAARVLERMRNLLARKRGPKTALMRLLDTPLGPLQRAVVTLDLPAMCDRAVRVRDREMVRLLRHTPAERLAA